MADFFGDDELTTQQLKEWARTYGLPIAAAVIVGIGGLLGWHWYQDHSHAQAQSSLDLFTDYQNARAVGEDTAEYIERMKEDHRSSPYFVFMQLHEARDRVVAKEYEGAIETLDEALDEANGTSLAAVIRIRKARLLMQLNKMDEAISAIQSMNAPGYESQALELLGDIKRLNGDDEGARTAYESALEQLDDDASDKEILLKLGSLRTT